MPIVTALLPEFDNEMKTTRAMLERVPEAKASFTPHAKSMKLGDLALHIPGLLSWIPIIVSETELDVMGPVAKGLHASLAAFPNVLAAFDASVPTGRAALAGASDETLLVPWTLRAADHTIFTLPRVAVLRTMVMNHIIHHRGQLSVYLRLNDVPLPDIYGPTADSVR
jgi:uncharacterized damage-inducible protein DinB